MKWYDSILTSVKSVFGLAHDASESEVHEMLQKTGSMEDAKEAILKSAEVDFCDKMNVKTNEFETMKNDLESKLTAANTLANDLQKQVTTLEGEVGLLQARILELETESTASHTNGETEPPTPSGKSGLKSYEQDAVTQRGMKIRTQVTK
jgi:hypothetical protein